MWNENQEVCEKKKRTVLTVERALFIVKLTDNFALKPLEQMKKNLIEKYLNISISKTQSYCLI